MPGARLIDTVAERLFGFVAGEPARGVFHRQPRGEHQRDDDRRPARVLRDGARRRVRGAGAAKSIRGSARRRTRSSRRRSGAACSCCPARCRSWSATPDLRSCCFRRSRWRRCSCCGAASRTTPRPFRAWGYPWAPAIFVIASALMLANEICAGARGRRPPVLPSSRPACRSTGGCGGASRAVDLTGHHSAVETVGTADVAEPLRTESAAARPRISSSGRTGSATSKVSVSYPGARTSIRCGPDSRCSRWKTPSKSSTMPA